MTEIGKLTNNKSSCCGKLLKMASSNDFFHIGNKMRYDLSINSKGEVLSNKGVNNLGRCSK